MKTTTKIAIWSLAALLAAGVTACKNEPEITEPHMTLTTTKNVGETIELKIFADPDDRLDIWIDLNNNGVEDSSESITDFSNSKKYTLGAQTVTIYGKIKSLICSENRLKALDVNRNNALASLICNNNQLTSLNVSKNTELEWLECRKNQLKALDVSKNSELEILMCDGNQLTTLNVSNNSELGALNCSSNQLKTLNVSSNNKLETLNCSGNQLSALDVSNNTKLMWLHCHNNTIFGSNMNVLVNGLPDRTKASDEGLFYVINLKDGDGNVCTKAQVSVAKGKKWKVSDSKGDPYTGS